MSLWDGDIAEGQPPADSSTATANPAALTGLWFSSLPPNLCFLLGVGFSTKRRQEPFCSHGACWAGPTFWSAVAGWTQPDVALMCWILLELDSGVLKIPVSMEDIFSHSDRWGTQADLNLLEFVPRQFSKNNSYCKKYTLHQKFLKPFKSSSKVACKGIWKGRLNGVLQWRLYSLSLRMQQSAMGMGPCLGPFLHPWFDTGCAWMRSSAAWFQSVFDSLQGHCEERIYLKEKIIDFDLRFMTSGFPLPQIHKL